MPDTEAEALAKLRALAKRRGETPAEMFAAYDQDRSGGLTAAELAGLLGDADIGAGPIMRRLYARRILAEADKDADEEISYGEAAPLLARIAPPKPPTPALKRLTDAQARDIALRIANGEDVDISPYDAESWGMIEDWNLRITNEKLPVTRGRPPKVPVKRPPRAPKADPEPDEEPALEPTPAPVAEAPTRPDRVFLSLLALALGFALLRR